MAIVEWIVLIVAGLLTAIALLVSGYYCLLAVCSLIMRPRSPVFAETPRSRFVIVIPAHDEEAGITDTIQSCQMLDYPRAQVSVVVIADNCSDRTGEVARAAGAECLVRQDRENRGKGHALAWGLGKLADRDYDAVVILDADCEISRDALRFFDSYLEDGFDVLQAKDVATNPDDSVISYAVTVGNVIENDLFYAGKDSLGWAILLRGTGMVFRKTVLQRLSWNAFSVAEDVEFSSQLISNRVPIKLVQQAVVGSRFPADRNQLEVQRTRWASGNLQISRTRALEWILAGIRSRNFRLADTGLTFLVISRPVVLAESGLALLVSLLGQLAFAPAWPASVTYIAASIVVFYVLYFVVGIVMTGITVKRMVYLAKVPLVIARLLRISILALIGGKKEEWERSPRD